MEITSLEYELEKAIDKYSLEEVLTQISAICEGKAEHVLINWQDEPLSKRWQKMSTYLDTVCMQAHKLSL